MKINQLLIYLFFYMDNCVNVTKQLLRLLNVKNTKTYLEDKIFSHPEHPSLLAVSDTLEKYNIETLAVKIDAEKLNKMPLPCVVQVNEHGVPLFFVLQDILVDKIIYYDDQNKLVKTPKEDFFKKWTGVCLLVETSEDSKEVDIEKKLVEKKLLNILKGSVILFLLSWIILSFLNANVAVTFSSRLYIIAYIILKLIGLTVGVLLLWFEVDQYNPTLQNFCSGGSEKINCNSVLTSKYAKLLNGTLSLSILGFSYFFGTFIYLIICSFSVISLSVLGLFSFITLPVIVISAYYQAFVIKQWCKFCIVIQGALVAEIVIVFFGKFYKANNLSIETLPLLLALVLMSILAWKIIKPLLQREKEVNIHKRSFKKIKNNPDVLEGLLKKSRKIETSSQGLGISMYNETAKYNVIKVCNPFCGPCAKAHPILDNLLNAGKINLQILFTASTDGKDIKARPVSHFLAIDAQGDKSKTQKALDDWYMVEQKDYEKFASRYPIEDELKQQDDKIEAMRVWCDSENIIATPTIFINGYELPKEYSIEDLKEVL
ncbi:vitamin K epoxide reductase family protein [Flavobacterium undicola]|uniref:vitamin K epoxide reductase family protein n=1 Tax=Flavobacterium undicola TaxID=1932779 RepID=UPI00137867B2|nr:vitamin K epoxide reductase family protein [Flavobacterium undicola]MBA0884205.1 VKOR family protein [Flavobacterium undicola]